MSDQVSKRYLLFLVVLLSGCATRSIDSEALRKLDKESSGSDAIWPLVAQSTIIVTGTMNVPTQEIRSRLSTGKHEYVDLVVRPDKVLKGTAPSQIIVRWFTEPKVYSPDSEAVIAADGQLVLLFLSAVEDPVTRGLYFAGYTPRALSFADPKLLPPVQREIADQDRILNRFSDLFPAMTEKHSEKVKSLIEATTRPEAQMNALRELERLGPSAVPAIILLMDDRRDLAIPAMSLENGPGGFEAIRHYGPKKVVDAMDALLNQLTGQEFGGIYNGGSESERKEAVRGWRIYLYHLNISTGDR